MAMILNIIDNRKRQNRWKSVHATVEATWHDNDVADADQVDRPNDEEYVLFEERHMISVTDAILWASELAAPVTLYLRDD
ncbi:hypothetical protein [Brevundimonas nasdae]|uniref:hypothetical protein n=1 Tax=Brevundimonas nasdae TaxID=172043 RepID=UPI0012ED41BA|nr:hypothetical protein [Brevundimonas nasdae]